MRTSSTLEGHYGVLKGAGVGISGKVNPETTVLKTINSSESKQKRKRIEEGQNRIRAYGVDNNFMRYIDTFLTWYAARQLNVQYELSVTADYNITIISDGRVRLSRGGESNISYR